MNSRHAVRQGRAALAATACAFALAACTPDYNWREIRQPADGYQVMLPAKPASMSRSINLDGLAVTMTMTGARVGDQTFTVGAAALPAGDAATRDKAATAMRAAMVRNIGGRETALAEVRVPVVDVAGRPGASQPAARIGAEGRVGDRPMHMSAQFVARGSRAWQVVFIGPADDAGHAQQFLDSFRIVE